MFVKVVPGNRHSIVIATLIFGCVVLLAMCMGYEEYKAGIIKNREGQLFAGSTTCAGYHQDIYGW